MSEETIKDKVVLINGSLLNTMLLIVLVVLVFGFFCSQIVVNYMSYQIREQTLNYVAKDIMSGSDERQARGGGP